MLGCSSLKRSSVIHPERTIFDRFARWAERQLGRSVTFALAVLSVVLWGATGPVFGWSDTWQLVINTGTTIVTFLMVFVIQNAQNRDTQALQLKLDELIRVNRAARNSLMGLEEKSESEVEDIKSALVDLATSTETATVPNFPQV
jgi:low affinity Fe/Cu permease